MEPASSVSAYKSIEVPLYDYEWVTLNPLSLFWNTNLMDHMHAFPISVGYREE